MNRCKNRVITFCVISAMLLLYICKIYFPNLYSHEIGDFASIFTSIVLEAMPFIILGSAISAIIQTCISEKFIAKIIPKASILGYMGAALIGLVFPVCECAIVPITRRLIKKGVPIGFGVTFMLAVPIINPVVIMSTYYAFYDKQIMVLLRIVGGFVASIIIGILVNALERDKQSLIIDYLDGESYCNCGCSTFLESQNKLKAIIEHTNKEFLDIMGYLIFGAFISGIFQVIVSHGGINFISNNKIIGIIIMMTLGFFLSLCSEVDAFVGRSFLTNYSFSGVLAFLILGPMLDLKNLIMIIGAFKKSFVLKLSICTISIVFLISFLFAICGL
ncbi:MULTISPECIES: permease [unclassified Clostridium]|uniref:permease n=1 Tax=unclassified Clostridium TaxID=2614128 RepID=UPI0002982661|nr:MULTISPECIES: permease [unclassified Clostridium]EKQ57080.1 MAG: putative permease [Clostridium sp. Maddingley MBC34-26]